MNSIQEIEKIYNVKWVDGGILADYYNDSKTELLDNKTNAISKKPGIYRLLLPIELVPEIKFVKPIRPTKKYGWDDIEELQIKLASCYNNSRCHIAIDNQEYLFIYIGKANDSNKALQTRLKTYLRYWIKECSHHGGSPIWQMSNWPKLHLAWSEIDKADPEKVEDEYLRFFANGTRSVNLLPLANRKGARNA